MEEKEFKEESELINENRERAINLLRDYIKDEYQLDFEWAMIGYGFGGEMTSEQVDKLMEEIIGYTREVWLKTFWGKIDEKIVYFPTCERVIYMDDLSRLFLYHYGSRRVMYKRVNDIIVKNQLKSGDVVTNVEALLK